VLDPMLATGGTLETVITMLSQRDAASVTAVCLLAAPEGIDRIKAAFPSDDEPLPVRVVTAALDERLNERGYNRPRPRRRRRPPLWRDLSPASGGTWSRLGGIWAQASSGIWP